MFLIKDTFNENFITYIIKYYVKNFNISAFFAKFDVVKNYRVANIE